MSLTLDEMRSLLRRGLGGLSSTELTDADSDLYLNMSLWELEARYPFESTESTGTIALVDGTRIYDLSTLTRFDAITSIAVVQTSNKRKKIRRMTRDTYDTVYNSSAGSKGEPEFYFREDTNLYVWPTPDSVIGGQNLEISFRQQVQSLLEGSVDSVGLPRDWAELVVEGAIARGHLYNQDYNLSREITNLQISKIRTSVPTVSKEERDSRYAGLKVQWDEPS